MYMHATYADGAEETRILRPQPPAEHKPPAVLILFDVAVVPAETAADIRMAARAALPSVGVLGIGLPAEGLAEVAGYVGHMLTPVDPSQPEESPPPGEERQPTPADIAAAYASAAIRDGSWDRWLLQLHTEIDHRIRVRETEAHMADWQAGRVTHPGEDEEPST